MTLTVKVISPDSIALDSTADEVILPSTTGQLGILTDHAPLITALDIGVMRYRKDKGWSAIAVVGGFAEVEENEVTLLVSSATSGASIDVEEARQELLAAEEALANVSAEDKAAKAQAEKRVRVARAHLQATAPI